MLGKHDGIVDATLDMTLEVTSDVYWYPSC